MGRRCHGIHINIGTCVGSAHPCRGTGPGNRMFVRSGEPERGPGSRGRCWLCTAPINALLRSSCPFSQPSFPCRAAFPVLLSHCPQLTGTEVGTQRGARAARPWDLILQAERGSWHFLKREKHLPLDTAIPPQKRREEDQKHRRSSWSTQVFPTRGGAGRRGRFMAGVLPGNKSSSSSSCSGVRAGRDQGSFPPDPILSVSSCILSWSTQPALPCHVSP